MNHDLTEEQSQSDRGANTGTKDWGANMEEDSTQQYIASNL